MEARFRLEVHSRTVGSADMVQIVGQPALGRYRLGFFFRVRLNPQAQLDQPRVESLFATVHANHLHLADIVPNGDLSHLRGRSDSVEEHQVQMWANLDSQQMAAIELLRNGGGLSLQIGLTARVSCGTGLSIPRSDYQTMQVNQSEWLDVLKACQYSDIVTLELTCAVSSSHPKLAAAVESLQDAERQLRKGEWTDCAVRCRKALEALRAAFGDGDISRENPAEWFDNQKKKSMAERYQVARKAAVLLAHPAAHVELDSATSFTSADARTLFGLTHLLIHHATSVFKEQK